MNQPIQFQLKTVPVSNSSSRARWWRGFILSSLAVACLGVAPLIQASDLGGVLPNGSTGDGMSVLNSQTSGAWNSGFGFEVLKLDTTGSNNTAAGVRALFTNTTGGSNAAYGVYALYNNTGGSSNTANGFQALLNNTTANDNTAIGAQALYKNTTGTSNTAVGRSALNKNTTGGVNNAFGFEALFSNTTGGANNAFGFEALFSNTTGNFNNAHGNAALFSNTTSCCNDAFGDGALANSTGAANTAIGDLAGLNLTTGSGNVDIGANVFGVAGESNTTRIRNIYETVQPAVGVDPDFVTVNSGNRLGRGNVSSRRYKHDIKPMDKASEALFALKPVSFRYDKEYDATQTIAFGLIAEDVAEVYPDLVGRNPKGEPESVRYEQINAMLLNEFLKEHRKVEELQKTVSQLSAQFKEQAAQIQRVSAAVAASKAAPRVVDNR